MVGHFTRSHEWRTKPDQTAVMGFILDLINHATTSCDPYMVPIRYWQQKLSSQELQVKWIRFEDNIRTGVKCGHSGITAIPILQTAGDILLQAIP